MRVYLLTTLLSVFAMLTFGAPKHPCLMLTPEGVDKIRESAGALPNFDSSLESVKRNALQGIAEGITVPEPLDNGGGYSHERHKDNYYQMYYCGIMYQITKEQKYALFVRDMLREYAKMYPRLGPHPQNKSERAGRIFWQPLNDCVWLAHTSMAYDCIYDFLSADDRASFERSIFRPMAKFLSEGNNNTQATFNSMHNHGTWAVAAVGMIGFVMNDKELIEISLKGTAKDGRGGFLRQLDVLFSPDGFYMEGAYYQRYALWPFIVYAQVLQNNNPELNIFAYRDNLLIKATYALLNQSYNGELLRINDAVYQTTNCLETVNSVDASYKALPTCRDLLDVAVGQGQFTITDAGLESARAIAAGLATEYEYKSVVLRDGSDGTKGGVAILRQGTGADHMLLLLKATSHGQSHGHYDKLTMLLNDNGVEILQDYGSVRYLNLEPRSGGGYTDENDTWALQTIAHNTVTVDEKSHFGGNFKLSSQHHADINYYDFDAPNIQVISARDHNASPGVKMQRTMAIVKDEALEYPLVIDIFKLLSEQVHTYDLPYYYVGTVSSNNFGMKGYRETMPVMGTSDGYEHLWVEGQSSPTQALAQLTWFNNKRFYSLNTIMSGDEQLYFVRMGANDPEMNIKREPGYIIRKNGAKNHTFVSTIEPHGLYDLVPETTTNFRSNVISITTLLDNEQYTAVEVKLKSGAKYMFVTVNAGFDAKTKHKIDVSGKECAWIGNYGFFTTK